MPVMLCFMFFCCWQRWIFNFLVMSEKCASSHYLSLFFRQWAFFAFAIFRFNQGEAGVPGSNSDLFHWSTAATMKVLSSTTTTTKAVLQAVSDRQWWKKSLTYLRPLPVSKASVFLKSTPGLLSTH